MASPTSASVRRLVCTICGHAFARTEHLTRHIATHTLEKHLQCSDCGRRFSRRDALTRHRRVHRTHTPLPRFRACTQCAAARTKCNGRLPCLACQQRCLACTFPEGVAPQPSPSTNDTPSLSGTAPVVDNVDQVAINQRPYELDFGAQPAGGAYGDMDFNMASSLNWVPPDFNFAMADLDYGMLDGIAPPWPPPLPSNSTPADDIPIHIASTHVTTPSTAADVSSPDGLAQSGVEGSSYVQDTGARLPRNGRYASRIFRQSELNESRSDATMSNFSIHDDSGPFYFYDQEMACMLEANAICEASSLDRHFMETFSPDDYQMILESFSSLCQSSAPMAVFTPYTSPYFPSLESLNALMVLYRCNFDPKVLPLIHRDLPHHPILKLAMAAIGCQYLPVQSMQNILAFHEFLRRLLLSRPRTSSALDDIFLATANARLLHHIGISYSGSEVLMKHSTVLYDDMLRDFESVHHGRYGPSAIRETAALQPWLFEEGMRRFCHSVWLLDAMSHYQSHRRPRLLLECAAIPLPCTEQSWQNPDASDPVTTVPTLEEALRILYVEKRLLAGIGDFAQILLIHGLYCQIWDISRSVSKPLLHWTPSADKGSVEIQLPATPWLPSVPLYNRWRNASCDCVDVLHWISNGKVAKTGAEDTTVFNLHFSRIVLLAPHQAIRRLVKLLIGRTASEEVHAEINRTMSEIRRWINEDRFKARLALIHCGVFLWHVRRYSTDAFYEPTATYMVTLTVWAYGMFNDSTPSASSNDRGTPSTTTAADGEDPVSDVESISSIRLDRPTDDELVQLYIKRGQFMKATINGVGDITATRGPQRMLREGFRLLQTLTKWHITQHHLRDLSLLAELCAEPVVFVRIRQSGRHDQETA